MNAREAQDQFERGIDAEAFDRLELISKTITVLKDFKSSVAALQQHVTPQQSSSSSPSSLAPNISEPKSTTKRDSSSKYETSRKSIKTNVEDTPTITSEVYSVNQQSSIYTQSGVPLQNTPRTHSHAQLDPNLIKSLDEIFVTFLQNICSNLDARDSKGEPIHQTLMAKKMQKLDESPDFRPFKFRIQAFTNAYHDELIRNGYTEEILPLRKDGKKAKSKGNHVWNIEAKKTPTGGWVFREFTRKIAGIPNKIAYVGTEYTYAPRVWDPQ
ncbi:13783_t:CDS:2, partial [Entrophospora sp. SA101]